MNLVALPVLIPLLTGSLLLLIKRPRARTAVSIVGASLTFLVDLNLFVLTAQGEVAVLQMAGWAAPWGISLVADGLTGIMLGLSGLIGLLTVIFAGSSLKHAPRRGVSDALNKTRERLGAQALFQFLLMGVNMSFLTGDLFNLFVAFEVMLIASYGLMILGNELPQLREGFKYVVINLVASAIFVAAAGFSYGLFGTLNMADIAVKLAAHGPDPRVTLVAGLLALVFTTKSALFPLGFWLPNSYPVPAAAVSAFFAALLTKVGAYTLIRSFTLMFPGEVALQTIVLALAGLTILVGAFGAIARQNWRYALAFANVASVGYIVMGAFTGTDAGLAAGLYYLMHSVLIVFTLFAIAGLAEKIGGEPYQTSGHLNSYPWLGVGFFFLALALAGLPPTSGFVGKYALITALLRVDSPLHVLVAVSAVSAGFLLLYAMMQIWRGFFWGETDAVHRVPLPLGMRAVSAVSVGLVVLLTIFSGPAFRIAENADAQLSDNVAYINAVLGEAGVEAYSRASQSKRGARASTETFPSPLLGERSDSSLIPTPLLNALPTSAGETE